MINNIGTRDIPEWSAIRVALKTTSNKKIEGSNAHLADISGDGKADVLVGDVSWEEFQLPPLSEAKEKEKREFEPQYAAAKAENDMAWDERNTYVGKAGGIPDEVTQRWQAADAKFAPLSEQWYSYSREKTRAHGYVWVVYQK